MLKGQSPKPLVISQFNLKLYFMKDINLSIHQFLSDKIKRHHHSFTNATDVPVIFNNLFDKLQSFNFHQYEERILGELRTNCIEWWTNEKQGIDPSEPLDAVLFEHDWDIHKTEIEANAYGIIDWQEANSYSESFDMGFNYDFAKEFYASPGITLYLFDELACLDSAVIPDDMLEKAIEDYNGYHDLRELYILNSYMTVHRALKRFVTTPEFSKLNFKEHLLFIIEEHDTVNSYPVWNYFR